jgi:hypothetical protein
MDDAIAFAQRIYADTQKNVSPYITAGQTSLPMMTQIATNLEASPLYKWELGQETTAANKALKARGLYNSGAGLKYMSDITNRLTAQEGANMWNRLGSLANYGLQGSQIQAGESAAVGNTVGNISTAAGQQGLQSQQMNLNSLLGLTGTAAGLYSGSQYTSALKAIANAQNSGSINTPSTGIDTMNTNFG